MEGNYQPNLYRAVGEKQWQIIRETVRFGLASEYNAICQDSNRVSPYVIYHWGTGSACGTLKGGNMPRAEFQRKFVRKCDACGSPIYRDEDSGELVFTCPDLDPTDDRSDEEKFYRKEENPCR